MDGTSETFRSGTHRSVALYTSCSEGFNHILNTKLNVLLLYSSLFNTHPAAVSLNTMLYWIKHTQFEQLHCKKKVSGWENLVNDIPAGDGKTANLFLQCTAFPACFNEWHGQFVFHWISYQTEHKTWRPLTNTKIIDHKLFQCES